MLRADPQHDDMGAYISRTLSLGTVVLHYMNPLSSPSHREFLARIARDAAAISSWCGSHKEASTPTLSGTSTVYACSLGFEAVFEVYNFMDCACADVLWGSRCTNLADCWARRL